MNMGDRANLGLGDQTNLGTGDQASMSTGDQASMSTGESANLGMSAGDCQPLQCDKAMGCIDGARNPLTGPVELNQLRGQLSDCAPCLNAFDMEVRLKTTMLPTMSELPSADFRLRMTETLASVDLSQLDITDF